MPILTREQADRLIAHICQEPNQREELIAAIRRDVLADEGVRCRELFVHHEENAIHELGESIRSLSRRLYADLSDDMLAGIVEDIREQYGELERFTLQDWSNDDFQHRLTELFEYVQHELEERLHLRNKPSLSITSRIVNAVLGCVPIITKGLKHALYKLGYLRHKATERLQSIMEALHGFYQRNEANVDAIVLAVLENIPFAITFGQAGIMNPYLIIMIGKILFYGGKIIKNEIAHHRNN